MCRTNTSRSDGSQHEGGLDHHPGRHRGGSLGAAAIWVEIILAGSYGPLMHTVVVRPEVEADVEGVVDVLEAVGAEGRWIGTEVPFDRAARAEGIRRSLL